MANLFLRWKIRGYEKKLLTADRASFYAEQAVSMGPILRVEKAFKAGRYAEAIGEAYQILMRFHDQSDAHYFLGLALDRVGEPALAAEHLKRAIGSHRKAMDNYDEKYVDALIALDRGQAVAFFDGLAEKDARARTLMQRLRYMQKL